MNDGSMHGRQPMLLDALDHFRLGLDLLDRAAAPAHIGAHVDLAIHQLIDAIDSHLDAAASQIERNAEPQ